MSKLLTILVDVDNVLEDLNKYWFEAVNKKYRTNVKVEDVTEWEVTQFFNGLSRTQIFSPLHTEELWKQLKPLDDSQKYLKRLKDDGHKVYLLTSAHPDTVAYKYGFIKKYFPYISFKEIIICSNKQMVMGDVLIDDAPHNLEGGNYKGILFDAHHNKNYNEIKEGFYRAHNWEEVYRKVCEIAEESDNY